MAQPEDEVFQRGWLGRSSICDPTEIAHDFILALNVTSREQIIRIAGRHWTIRECFEQAKQLTGLDEYEVHSLLDSVFRQQSPDPKAVLSFSAWRRHHQLIARHSCDTTRRSP